jgi:hypothetical protein
MDVTLLPFLRRLASSLRIVVDDLQPETKKNQPEIAFIPVLK